MELGSVPLIIRNARIRHHLSCAFLASFLGIPVQSAFDLEGYDDGIDSLTVIEFIRLAVALRLSTNDIFASVNVPVTKVTLTPPISTALADRLGDLTIIEDSVGFYADAVKQWLTNDSTLGEMPLPALAAICEHLAIDIASVLESICGEILCFRNCGDGSDSETRLNSS